MLEVVKDCICCDWTLVGEKDNGGGGLDASVDEQVIYTATGLCPIVSGKVEFCSATAEDDDDPPPNSVFVQFLRGNRVIDSKEVFLDSCIAFTVAKFDTIKVKRKIRNDDDKDFTLSGNFCINANFTLH
jgi:hypothetical protein